MIRKCAAIAALALVGLLASPGAAQAYTPIDDPVLELDMDPDDIVIGQTQVPFGNEEWLPGSEARFSVSAPGVGGASIAIEVLSGANAGDTANGSIGAVVQDDGTFEVGVVFPEAAVYTVVTEGSDADGNARTVSLQLALGQGGGGGNGGGTGGGLPFTGSNTFTGLLLGAGLAGVGGAVILMSRRRAHSSDSIGA